MKIDLSGAAVADRLRLASRMAGRLRPEDRLLSKIDMSAPGIERRLREASDLLELCRALARAGSDSRSQR